jgi:hypothetical protein
MESETSELSSHVMVKQKQKKEKINGAAGQKSWQRPVCNV